MNTTDTRLPTPQHTERWTATYIFRAAAAITLGILTALLVTIAVSYLVLGGTGRVVLHSDGVIEEVSSQVTDDTAASPVSFRPDPWWMTGEDCDADACTMSAPRTRTA